MSQTEFGNKVSILAELMREYKDDPSLASFMEFSDIGMPLAYFVDENLCRMTEDGKRFIEETWDYFLANFGVEEEVPFTNLQHVFDNSNR